MLSRMERLHEDARLLIVGAAGVLAQAETGYGDDATIDAAREALAQASRLRREASGLRSTATQESANAAPPKRRPPTKSK